MIYVAIVTFCLMGGHSCREIPMLHKYPTLELCRDGLLIEASDWLRDHDPDWKWHYAFNRCEIVYGQHSTSRN